MFKKLCCAIVALSGVATALHAADTDAGKLPRSIAALAGCWSGRGEVMGKAVRTQVAAKPIVQNAMLVLEAKSIAETDPDDRYSVHLIFGGADKQPDKAEDQISGFWADSFGGAFTATGHGESRPDGFDISYQYTDNAFVNRWRISDDRITWKIVDRDSKGIEKPFASYLLNKTACINSQR